MDPGGFFEGAITALGLAGLGGGAFAVLRSRQIKDSLELTAAANAELRSQIDDLEERNERSERRCDDRITQLEAKVEILEGDVVAGIVRQVEHGIERATERAVAAARRDP